MTTVTKGKRSGTRLAPLSLVNFLFKNTSEVIILLTKNFKILDINPAGQKYFSFKNIKLITAHKQPVTRLFSARQMKSLERGLLNDSTSRLVFTKAQKPLIGALQYLLNAKQQIVGYIFQGSLDETIEELRARAQAAEQKYLNTNTLLQNIIDSAPGLIYWKDKQGRYLGVNKYWCETLGVKNFNKVIGQKDEAFWPGQAKQLRRNDRQAMASGETIKVEEKTHFSDQLGEIIFMSVKSPLRDADNNITGIIGTSLDITELKRTQQELVIAKEKAETANRTKASFIATISHEIRTPMNAILGMAQILSDKNLTPEQKECVDIIQSSGKNLLELINDILDYSKLEAHKLEIKPAPFNLTKLINDACEGIKYKVVEKQVGLSVNYLDKMPALVIGDEMRIRQILLNLLTNAAKFTEKGQIKVSIEAKSKKNHILFKITVADTGIGIAPHHLNMVFERFMQVDSQYNRRFTGTGLGLAIVKSLVEAMGGAIGVESQLGQGSRFWFTLLLKPCTDKTVMAPQEPQGVPEPPAVFTRSYLPRLLVVEDNKLNQKVIKMMLQELGCELDIANDAAEALAFFKKKPYHLIFMDIGLPGMNGLEAIETMRRLKNKNHHVPIIALTAHVGEEDFDNCISAGANDVLTKPIMRNILIKKLDEYCP